MIVEAPLVMDYDLSLIGPLPNNRSEDCVAFKVLKTAVVHFFLPQLEFCIHSLNNKSLFFIPPFVVVVRTLHMDGINPNSDCHLITVV